MSLITEMHSIEAFLKEKFPSAQVLLHDMPQEPAADSFSVALMNDVRKSETHLHIRTEREFQLRYAGTGTEAVLETMDLLSSLVYQTQLIPITDAPRFLRIASFTFSTPNPTGNGLFICTGSLRTEGRTARTQESYEKMQHVYVQQVTV
ncbi:hypothetical protein [Paenibacillus rigui]|uniref:Uncharacterized protein n=1 Tax=Paenibacillus rigui TaxID=554312 RepID=A0A229USU6_9BACL|nr:hypothetical protein [Paenibacillus rigui]OXM86464.1 hypothetical protein CF651_09820 [Paenibacillus rigui]